MISVPEILEEAFLRRWFVLIELGLAIVVGIVFAIVFNESWKVGWIPGTVLFFALEVVRLNWTTARIRQSSAILSNGLEALRGTGTDNFWRVLLLYSLNPTSDVWKWTVSVGKSQVLDFWRDCVGATKLRWWSVSYATGQDVWERGWKDHALAIQGERIRGGCEILRVFIVEDDNEHQRLQAIMHDQKEIGITVHWLLMADVKKSKRIMEPQQKLSSWDAALVDGAWAFITELDKHRNVRGALATRDASVVENVTQYVNAVKELAEKKPVGVATPNSSTTG
jgi:hypothetical protein